MKSRIQAIVYGVVGSVLAVSPAFAVDANMDTLFAAVDTTGLSAKVLVLLSGAIAIPLLFTGYALLKKGVARYRG